MTNRQTMHRPSLTFGNVEYAVSYLEALHAHFIGRASRKKCLDKARPHLNAISAAITHFQWLKSNDLSIEVPKRTPVRGNYGVAAFAEPMEWSRYLSEDIAPSFGRGGPGTITTIAEALVVVNGLARGHGADRIYYRGEHKYGFPLKSRAHRKMEKETGLIGSTDGITPKELSELRRFQQSVRASTDLRDEIEIVRNTDLPDDSDPEWLCIMQHHDEKFGTRLLDITRSIFAGLHFACVDWDGTIDFETDGLLYVFFRHGRYYVHELNDTFDDDLSELVPEDVAECFKGWRHPEYMHHFRSTQSSMREMAQDGQFLVQGNLGLEPLFGGNKQFRLCVPWWAKARIIEELWFAGYTPERLVRGKKGREAALRSEQQIKERMPQYPGWHLENEALE